MPFIHFHAGNGGKVQACCVANIPFGNINHQSLEELWNGEPINQLRAKFLKGEIDNRCAVCINLEKAGSKSIRQETFEKFPNIDVSEIKNPIYFDIRFSNVCNFRCRTCWHGASSKWFNDAKQLGTNLGEKAILQNIQDFNDFITKTGDSLLKAEEIYFAGGEPLVTEEHYLLLEFLIKHNKTNVRLRYNTNFSVLKFKQYNVLELWKNFKDVELLASIDASEELGEYIRKEFDWKLFLENRNKIRLLENVRFKIAPTISVMNILELPRLYQKCIELDVITENDFYINILERPLHYNIQIFPKELKEKVNHKFCTFLEENILPENIQFMFQDCLNYMNAKDASKHWQKFLSETKQLDELRNEKIERFA